MIKGRVGRSPHLPRIRALLAYIYFITVRAFVLSKVLAIVGPFFAPEGGLFPATAAAHAVGECAPSGAHGNAERGRPQQGGGVELSGLPRQDARMSSPQQSSQPERWESSGHGGLLDWLSSLSLLMEARR